MVILEQGLETPRRLLQSLFQRSFLRTRRRSCFADHVDHGVCQDLAHRSGLLSPAVAAELIVSLMSFQQGHLHDVRRIDPALARMSRCSRRARGGIPGTAQRVDRIVGRHRMLLKIKDERRSRAQMQV